MSNEQINVDLIPGRMSPTCHCSQYDIGRTIRINLTQGGVTYTLDGTETISVEVRKPDGNFVTASCTATSGNAYVDVVTTEQMTAVAGMNLCNLKIEKGGNTIGTLNFIMAVEADPIDGASASESVIENLQAMVNADVALALDDTVTKIEAKIDGVKDLILPVYSIYKYFPSFQYGTTITDNTNHAYAVTKDVIVLDGNKSTSVFTNLLDVDVTVGQIKYDDAAGTNPAATTGDSVAAGASLTISNSTRKYYGIRVKRNSGTFSDTELSMLGSCLKITDTTRETTILQGNATILDRVESDIEAKSAVNVEISNRGDINTSKKIEEVYTPFLYFPLFKFGKDYSSDSDHTYVIAKDIITFTDGTPTVDSTAVFTNPLSYAVSIGQIKYDDAAGTNQANASLSSVASGASLTITNVSRKYWGVRIRNTSRAFTDEERFLLNGSVTVTDNVAKNNTMTDYFGENHTNLLDRLVSDEQRIYEATGGTFYPSYYDAQMATALASIKSNMADIGKDGCTFVFITDPHWGINEKHSPALIRKILKETNVQTVVCGGDVLDSDSLADAENKATSFINSFKFVFEGIKMVFGNHDANQNNHAQNPELIFSDPKTWAFEFAQADYAMNVGGYFYYYFDIPATKTRFIVLSTFWNDSDNSTAQESWFTSLMQNSADWNVIIATHSAITYDGQISTFFEDLETLIDSCNTNNNIKLIVAGHIHTDAVGETTGGIPIIATDTDARSRLSEHNPNTATVGTITEHCFDVISVDYVNETVKCIRIGRGSDRQIPI